MTAAAGAGLGAEDRARTEAMDAAAYEWLYRRVMGNGTVHFDSDAMEPDERWVRYFARQMALFATDRLAAADRDAGLGVSAREISDLIDGAYPPDLDREAWAWRRVMKVAEEVGEVNEAMLGWLGENPRKGLTHTSDDVRKELLDVALAALGACAHLDQDSDPAADLAIHAAWVRARLRAALDTEVGS